MRTRSRIDTPSSSSACSTRCTSPRVSRVGVSSSTTTGCVRLTISTRSAHVLAAEQVGGVLPDDLGEVRGDDRRAVDDGGAGHLRLPLQLDGHPLGGQAEHRLAGRSCRAAPSRSSPIARTVPAGEMPFAAGTPLSRMTYCEAGRSRLSRVRTSGMTRPRSMATLRRSALTRSSRSPPRAGSTRSTRSKASSSSSGSTRIFSAMASGESGLGSCSSAAAAASASSSTAGDLGHARGHDQEERRRRGGTAASAGRG